MRKETPERQVPAPAWSTPALREERAPDWRRATATQDGASRRSLLAQSTRRQPSRRSRSRAPVTYARWRATGATARSCLSSNPETILRMGGAAAEPAVPVDTCAPDATNVDDRRRWRVTAEHDRAPSAAARHERQRLRCAFERVDSADRDFELPLGQQYDEVPQLPVVGMHLNVGDRHPRSGLGRAPVMVAIR